MDPLSTLYAAGITPTLGADGRLHPIPDPLNAEQEAVWHSVREYVVQHGLRESLVAAVRCGQSVVALRGTVDALADELHSCFHGLTTDVATWTLEPWCSWRRALHDQEDREQWRPTHEDVARVEAIHGGHRQTILRLLMAAGPRGVTNHELQDAIGKGARHSARIGELTSERSKKHGGWLIDSIKVDGNTHRWVLKGRLSGYGETQGRLEEAA